MEKTKKIEFTVTIQTGEIGTTVFELGLHFDGRKVVSVDTFDLDSHHMPESFNSAIQALCLEFQKAAWGDADFFEKTKEFFSK